jgi:hypothetical protein
MADKGLASKDRNFVTPLKRDVVKAILKTIRGPTARATRKLRRQALLNCLKYNRDIGHHR